MTYNLDDAGNRNSVVETGQGTKTYVHNAMNQYTAAGADAVTMGSMNEISGYKGITYKYYGDTYLSSVTAGGNSYQYIYDALGRMVERQLNDVAQNYYLYDGEHWITEYNGLGALYSNTLYGNGIDEVISRGVNGQGQFFLPDRNGNTMVVTGGFGGANMAPILEGYRYDAFGAPRIFDPAGNTRASSAIGNRFLFTGREYNSLCGFYEYRARAYHPGLGRFMSEDPKGFGAQRIGILRLSKEGDPLRADESEYNLYRYVGNDPLDFSDPMGLNWRDNLNLLVDFLLGRGQTHRTYTGDSNQAQEMARSPNVNRARDDFNRKGHPNQLKFQQGHMDAYVETILKPAAGAITTGNSQLGPTIEIRNPFSSDRLGSAAAQVGGYAGATITNNGDGTATFHIHNVAGAKSFFGQKVPNTPKGWSGPFRSIVQDFVWTEKIE